MGLEHGHQPLGRAGQGAAAAAHHQPGHGQGGRHFAGMVGVVIDHLAPLPGAAVIEAATGGLQAGQGLAQVSEGHPLEAAGRQGAGGVAEVVQARQGQGEAAHQLAPFVEIGHAAVAVELHRDGGEVHRFCLHHRPPGLGIEVLPQDRVIPVGQQALAALGELLQGADQGVQIRVMVRVVQLQVGDHPEAGGKFHQGAIGFVGFSHQQGAGATAAVAAEGGHDAADHGRGVLVGARQQGGHHGAGGGLAVAAGNGNGALGADQGAEHVGAMAHLKAESPGLR